MNLFQTELKCVNHTRFLRLLTCTTNYLSSLFGSFLWCLHLGLKSFFRRHVFDQVAHSVAVTIFIIIPETYKTMKFLFAIALSRAKTDVKSLARHNFHE